MKPRIAAITGKLEDTVISMNEGPVLIGRQAGATLKIGKGGISPSFLTALDEALQLRQLFKVKFDEFKEQKRELAPQLAEKSGSHLVTRVGNVVVLFRPKASESEQAKLIKYMTSKDIIG